MKSNFNFTPARSSNVSTTAYDPAQRKVLEQVLEQALEALELHAKQYPHMQKGYTVDAIAAIQEILK